jgi:hypothetical protein
MLTLQLARLQMLLALTLLLLLLLARLPVQLLGRAPV